MAKYLIQGETLTAIADAIREGSSWNGDWVGTSIAPGDMPQAISEVRQDGYSEGYHVGKSIQTAPTISVSTSGLITATADGKSSTRQLSTVAGKTVTPTTYNFAAVSKNYFTTGAVTVKGDSYLIPNNIKKGVTIFGKAGTFDNYELGMLNEVPYDVQTTGTTFNTNKYGGGYTAYTVSTFSGVYKPTVTHSGIQYTLNSWISVTTEGDESNPYIIHFTNQNRTFGFRLFVNVTCSWDQHVAREEFYEVVTIPKNSTVSVDFSYDDTDGTWEWTYDIEGAFAYDF